MNIIGQICEADHESTNDRVYCSSIVQPAVQQESIPTHKSRKVDGYCVPRCLCVQSLKTWHLWYVAAVLRCTTILLGGVVVLCCCGVVVVNWCCGVIRYFIF